ncbi:Variant SH3 domain containing protein [Aphelenchoides avenae]|nr:Variant SH3 domain containing protein [Aphelenchus avenae]
MTAEAPFYCIVRSASTNANCIIQILPDDDGEYTVCKMLQKSEDDVEQENRMIRRRTAVAPTVRPGKFPVPEDDLPAQRPFIRPYTVQQQRRSRSQPSYQPNGDDSDECPDDIVINGGGHVSRADRFSIDSEASHSQDSGIRSSTHSNASATTSTASSHDEAQGMLLAEAVWDHVAMLSDELPFSIGDMITVLDSTSSTGLWYGCCKEKTGWFPATYVRVKNGEVNRLSSVSTGSSEDEFPQQMRYLRRRVIEELMETERDYVALLQNLVQGFVEQCRRRKEMFSDDRIQKIFGNIEQISVLHCKLLRQLELSFDQKAPENSCVASAFLRNSQGFTVYTEYCNNRPVSCSELATLQSLPQYHHFFEACRLLRGMAKLSLEGFLLTPVQRICRYPLQLFELLKATPLNHTDRMPLEQAHRTMRAVASHINDAKRRLDAIQKIILWQRNVHGFRGPDLVDNNCRMLISGEMYCRAIMRGTVQWSKTVHVYLFDQSIVLCKKDVLKKNALIFKERMSLQSTSIIDLPDGKDSGIGANLKNSFKLSGPSREYIFTCPDPATKGLWLETSRNRPRPMPPTNAEKRLSLITLGY